MYKLLEEKNSKNSKPILKDGEKEKINRDFF